MARSNTGVQANWFSTATAPLNAFPATLACWFNPVNITTSSNLVIVGNSTGANGDYIAIAFDGANGYALLDNSIIADFGGISAIANSSTTVPAGGVWHHACGVFASTTSRTAYLNGVAGTTNTASVAKTTWNLAYIGGYRSGGTTFSPLNGSVAEAAVWAAALDAAEIASLSAGVSPRMVRPGSLVAYWPLIGQAAPEPDIWRGLALTQNGTMTRVDHPRIIYPGQVRTRRFTTALSVVNLRNTQSAVRTLVLPTDAKLRDTQSAVRTLVLPTDAKLRDTQSAVRVLRLTAAESSADGSITLGSIATAGTGGFTTSASGAVTLGNAAAAGVATFKAAASGAVTLGSIASTGAGVFTANAPSAVTLGTLAPVGAAKFTASAAGAIALGPFIASGSTSNIASGSGTITTSNAASVGAATFTTSAAGTVALGSIAIASPATFTAGAAGTLTLGSIVSTGAGTSAIAGTSSAGAITLGIIATASPAIFTASASGAVTLGSIIPAGISSVATGVGSVTMGRIAVAGAATASTVVLDVYPEPFASVSRAGIDPFSSYSRYRDF